MTAGIPRQRVLPPFWPALSYKIDALIPAKTESHSENAMSLAHNYLQLNKPGLASSILRQLTIALAISVFALALAGCGKKDDKVAETEPLVINGNFPVAEPALSNAVIRGNVAETQKIMASGVDINASDTLGRTALHIAAFYGRVKVIELLITGGADVNAKDHTGMTPLHAAVISGGRQSVQLLLDKQADIGAQTEAGQTALHLAGATGQPKLTKFLIERGADPVQKDFEGKTPLYYAKKNYHPQTTKVLEQASAKKPPSPATATR